MRHPVRSMVVLFVALLVTTGGAMTDPSRALSDEPVSLDRWLAAGEFAPAMAWARRQPPDVRDAALARIAVAQRRAGAWRAARRSVAEISNAGAARQLLLGGGESYPGSNGGATPFGGRGGGVVADFDTLMTLIQETINPDSWEENGGNGRMSPFPLGVLVDARGTLKLPGSRTPVAGLDEAARAAQRDRGNRDAAVRSHLRKVSLNRLERQLLWRRSQGLEPTAEMQHLAGLYRITHVFFYPETGDVVIAGPADDWTIDRSGRAVSRATRQPTLWLDDFIVIWRNTVQRGGQFWCSIEPRPARLRQVADLLATKGAGKGLRSEWLKKIRDTLGPQDIVVQGIDPESRVARVIVEADYRMKRIGIGLDESVFGVPSYLDLLAEGPPSKSNGVLRWWFQLASAPVQTSKDRSAILLPEKPVQLKSENPLIAADGTRRATGTADHHNRRFASLFTQNYDRIEHRYPLFADLRNVMQWALVAALIHDAEQAERISWHGAFFLDADQCPIARGNPVTQVDSIVNFQKITRQRSVAAVSGGVLIDAKSWSRRASSARPDKYGKISAAKASHGRSETLPADVWWWD